MSNIFKRKYDQMWNDEIIGPDGTITIKNGNTLTRNVYGRRKFAVIRAMSQTELYQAFGKEFEFKKSLEKEEIVKLLKRHSWRI